MSDAKDRFSDPEVISDSLCGPLWAFVLCVVLFAAAAFNPVEFKTDPTFDRANSTVKWPTTVKLAIAAAATACGTIGILFSAGPRRLLLSVPGLGLAFLGTVFVATSVFAKPEVATISRAASLIYCGYLAFLATVVAHLGIKATVRCIVAGTIVYLIGTWVLYTVSPEMGRFYEPLAGGGTVSRMGGLGHPNHVARSALSVGLVLYATLMSSPPSSRSLILDQTPDPSRVRRGPIVLVLLFIAATVFMTLSRTAALAGAAAAVWMVLDRLWGRAGIVLSAVTMAFAMTGVLAITLLTGTGPLSEEGLRAMTKSGDIREITSITGRTEIWQEVFQRFQERPLVGWGFDSAPSVLSDHATACHNILLNMAFSSGILAAVLIVLLLAWSFLLALTARQRWIRGLMAYVLICGLVEDTLFDAFPPALTLLWIVAMLLPPLSETVEACSSEKA